MSGRLTTINAVSSDIGRESVRPEPVHAKRDKANQGMQR